MLKYIIILGLITTVVSCKKFVEVDPPKTELDSELTFNNDATATAAMIGLYTEMVRTRGPLSVCASLYLGQAADDLGSVAPSRYYQNSLTPTDADEFWSPLYNYIYQANLIIESVEKSTGMTLPVKTQLSAEAKFIRAFCNFYLVNIYGRVPLVTTSDYETNGLVKRTDTPEVYKQIIADLGDAVSGLNENYLGGTNQITNEKVRPNKAVAHALLARVYLYLKNWEKAEAHATELISNAAYDLEPDLNKTFLANSNEAIWQLMSPYATNTWEGYYFIVNATPATFENAISPEISGSLLAAFEDGDKRKTEWISSFTNTDGTWRFPFKYKIKSVNLPSEYYTMMLRLAEQYLIRAEARAQQDDIIGAIADVNEIRARARAQAGDLPAITTPIEKNDLLEVIWHEKQVEFFAEAGHRWFDLKRTGKADNILGAAKGEQWQPTDKWFPIPQTQIDRNPNMKNDQNLGY